MKKNYIITLFLMLCFGALSYGQGSESFANSNATGSYADNSFVGDGGITWTYVASRNANNTAGVTLPAVMLRRSSSDSKITSSTISGGIGNFSVKLYKGFTGAGNRQVELFINGESKGTSVAFDDFDEHVFSVSGINVSGDIVIEIKNITEKQVIVDDISWTAPSSDPAINTIGTISLLEYFEGNGPSPEKGINVEGTNLTSDITVTAPTNFEVSVDATGTYSQSIALAQTSGEVASTPIYVRLKEGLGEGTFADNITLSSAGAESVTIAVTGEVKNADPQFTYAESLSKFSYTLEEGPSDVQNFSVEGLFLTDDFIIAAPENFEISFSQDTDFASSLSITPADGKIEDIIYIRLKAGITVPGNYQGDVTLSSAGVTAVTFNAEGVVYGELTNNIIISGVFDGSLTGGIPKGVELYVLEDVADLSLFGLSSVSNGGGSTDGDIEFNFPSIAVTAGTFIYISSSEAGFTDFFGKNADYITGVVNINGDDSIELYENGKIIDVFGNVNKDGSGETWEYLDGWAYRNSTSSPQGTTFTDTNWSYSGVDGLEGGTNNATATTPFPIGTFQPATAAVSRNSIEGFKTFPNPVTNKEFTVSTNNTSVKQIIIFNVLGKKVYAASFSGVKSTINVSDMNAGVYIVKVTEDGKTATKKLVIR
ncbi:T9SS type A sorting domain-containing protein [Polaribacter marinaquae]|uniref:T9SS type A sorting domain-containing protein n=1 Tax=Polaribacter marinaquae TaxID=1642819 RepID=A0ABZ2TPA2_9FLAO